MINCYAIAINNNYIGYSWYFPDSQPSSYPFSLFSKNAVQHSEFKKQLENMEKLMRDDQKKQHLQYEDKHFYFFKLNSNTAFIVVDTKLELFQVNQIKRMLTVNTLSENILCQMVKNINHFLTGKMPESSPTDASYAASSSDYHDNHAEKFTELSQKLGFVTIQMKKNVDDAINRGGKIHETLDKTKGLKVESSEFSKTAAKMNPSFWSKLACSCCCSTIFDSILPWNYK